MPRSASKSRADKGRSRSSFQVTPPPTQEPEVDDLTPIRLTQAQWMDIVVQEDTDETVGEIMEELMRKVMEGCLNAYIKKQLIPFSASWAISYLTQRLEQELLCLDEGDEPEEASKTEDSEPVPTAPEPWAQGCLPVDHQSIPRLDPSCLPRHQILPQYEILDNKYTRTNPKKPSGRSTLEQRRKKQISDVKAASKKPPTSFENQPGKANHVVGMLSSGPVSLDKMELSEDVVLLDPQEVDINLLEVKCPALSTKLRVMPCDEVVPLYSVEQVTGGPPPQVTPLFQPKGWGK
ncbi:uncharacterized protein C2orf81 homolog [Brachionichthys hirsutus]|uniref:uncharacterized protein C2orf81 homolog n=1 Tax=Brachionichthys hirsutus TaxID=412623 RepID=UPI00360490DD